LKQSVRIGAGSQHTIYLLFAYTVDMIQRKQKNYEAKLRSKSR